jgi:hypothetical protein
MSIHVLSWVLRNSEAKLGARLTLIALAEFAHDDGSKAFPNVETLTERTLLSRSGVKASLKRLREDGMIEQTGTLRNGTPIYRVLMTQPTRGPESDPGRNPAHRGSDSVAGGPDSGPNPLKEPSDPSRTGVSARAKLRVNGKPVKDETWRRTVSALNEFNAQANRSLCAVTGTGEPSQAAKRIYQRLAAWPNLSDAEVADVIRRTLTSRWWGADAPSIGVVFGPNVFEENLSRAPIPAGVARLHNGRRRGASVADFQALKGTRG